MPCYKEISYKLSGKKVVAISDPEKWKEKGYMMISGPIENKKVIYIIPKIDRNESIDIPREAVDAFIKDYKNKENSLSLPKDKDKHKDNMLIQGKSEDEKLESLKL